MYWLIIQDVLNDIHKAHALGITPTAEQTQRFEARHGVGGETASRILTIAGDQAEIKITGVLTEQPDFMAFLFGGGNTTFNEIIEAFAEADNDEAVTQITMVVDSPGGSVNGMFDAMAAIQAVKTPVRAVGVNVVASAAFGLFSQADEAVAANRATMFGSVGVMMAKTIDDSKIVVTSTEAPDKDPDLTTEAGRASVVAMLDDMHELFVNDIAAGRGTTVEDVNANFGRGAIVLADKALARGMIDSIEGPQLAAVVNNNEPTAATGETEVGAEAMDLEKLKAEHPGLYASIIALGIDQGITQERDRVGAHLTLGQASGAIETAIKAITDGTELTAGLQAEYMAAGMNREDVQTRSEDDDDAGDGDGGSESDEGDDQDAVDAKASNDILTAAADLSGVSLGA